MTLNNYERRVHNALRQIREAKGMSIATVAERADTCTTTVFDSEHGYTSPQLNTLLRILYAMDADLSDLALYAEANTQ